MHIRTKAQVKELMANRQSDASKEHDQCNERMDYMDNLYWSSQE